MNDLISRQAALDIYDDYNIAVENGELESYRRYRKQMLALPSEQPEWIPCSRELPKKNGQYIVTVKYEHVDGYEDIYSEHGEWHEGRWDMFCFGHCGRVEKVLAWMPLPAPYHPEGKKE